MQNFKYFTEAKMARQHFQLIADVIAGLEISTAIKKTVAEKFADAFEDTNPAFRRDKFIKATRASVAGYTRKGDPDPGTARGNRQA